MQSCVQVAKDLSEYATQNFTNEIFISKDHNLTNPLTLGLAFTEWISIDKIGLEVPPTTVPQSVIAARNTLTDRYYES